MPSADCVHVGETSPHVLILVKVVIKDTGVWLQKTTKDSS